MANPHSLSFNRSGKASQGAIRFPKSTDSIAQACDAQRAEVLKTRHSHTAFRLTARAKQARAHFAPQVTDSIARACDAQRAEV